MEPIDNETLPDFEGLEPWPESMLLFYDVYLYVSLFIYSSGVIANSLIILFIATKKSRKMSVYYFLLLNLAIIDLIICCWLTCSTVLLLRMYEWLEKIESEYSLAEQFFEDVLAMTASWFLVLLCFIKYRKILHPFQRQPNKRVCLLVSILLFLSALGIHIFKETVLPFGHDWFIWLESSIDTIIPLAFLVFFHNKIWMYLKSSAMENTQVRARYSKAIKTMTYLTVQFFVTVVLTRVATTSIEHVYDDSEYENLTFTRVTYILFLFNFTNNMLNAVVYARIMKDFRKFLGNIFSLNLKKQPQNPNNTSTLKVNTSKTTIQL